MWDAVALSIPKAMRRPDFRIKQIQFPHLLYLFIYPEGTGKNKMIMDNSKKKSYPLIKITIGAILLLIVCEALNTSNDKLSEIEYIGAFIGAWLFAFFIYTCIQIFNNQY